MVVAKRQKEKRLWKRNERKPVDWSENFKWNKNSPFLASPICRGQAQWGEDKQIRGIQSRLGPLLLGQPTLTPWRCTFLCLPNKTELWSGCNTGLPFQIFAAARQTWGNDTLPWHTYVRLQPLSQTGILINYSQASFLRILV